MKSVLKKNLANIITFLRTIFSLLFLFCEFLKPLFLVFYTLAGLTDVLDGFAARKTKAISKFGSKFDSISDLIFFVCLFIKLIVNISIDWRIYFVIIFIALIKICILIIGFKKSKKLFVYHNIMNKITGVAIFFIPFLLMIINRSGIIIVIVCSLALLSSFVEFKEMIENNAEIIE